MNLPDHRDMIYLLGETDGIRPPRQTFKLNGFNLGTNQTLQFQPLPHHFLIVPHPRGNLFHTQTHLIKVPGTLSGLF